MLKTERLRHGGIMANYRCTAACRHCLYACSPTRCEGYINKETTEEVCKLLREGGCRSVHIGGGEPFMDFDGLVTLVQTLEKNGITVEYIETNAYWCDNRKLVEERLRVLANAGADTLCISLDPFHAEYVPFEKPLYLAEICRGLNFGYFLWQDRFARMLSRVDAEKAHDRLTLEREISPDYIWDTATAYGIRMGGRAINIEDEYTEGKSLDEVINNQPCRGLLSGGHFHVDMYGRYVPPGCTGVAIPLDEAIRGIPEEKYPVFTALTSGGVAGLLAFARKRGFMLGDDSEFPSSCALCFHIRHWLSGQSGCPELDREHYEESLKYYA
jgi:hypothetical protein